MVKINYEGQHHNLRLAVNSVNNLLQQDYFYRGIQQHEGFDMADITPKQLAGLIRIAGIVMKVDVYYSLFPFSKAFCYTDPADPATIYLNKWNLNRSVESISNTLMHQCVHAVNSMFPQFSFGHGDEEVSGKENTAPFWIAALAQKIIADDNSVYEALNHEDVNNIPFLQHFCMAQPMK